MPLIESARVLILAADGFGQSQLFRPRERLKDLGVEVRIASTGIEPIRGNTTDTPAIRITPDMTLDQVDADGFDALLIPGGEACREALCNEPQAIEIVRGFAQAGKPVAASCEGAELLVAADLMPGEMSEEAVLRRDGNLVTVRGSDDLPAFTEALIEMIGSR